MAGDSRKDLLFEDQIWVVHVVHEIVLSTHATDTRDTLASTGGGSCCSVA